MKGYEQAIKTLEPSHIIRYGVKHPGEWEEISTYYINDNTKFASNGRYGSYYFTKTGAPTYQGTHTSTGYRIDGHKILVQTRSPSQSQIPMNSHSENPVYLCAKVDKTTEEIKISSVSFYEKHRIVESIDIKVDKNGDFIPYGNKNGSHSHKWFEKENGEFGRKSHDNTNNFPIAEKYNDLINKIVEFNKSKKVWKR